MWSQLTTLESVLGKEEIHSHNTQKNQNTHLSGFFLDSSKGPCISNTLDSFLSVLQIFDYLNEVLSYNYFS